MRLLGVAVVLLLMACGDEVEPTDVVTRCEAGTAYQGAVDLCSDGEGVCVAKGDTMACLPVCNDDGGPVCNEGMWSSIAVDGGHVCYCE